MKNTIMTALVALVLNTLCVCGEEASKQFSELITAARNALVDKKFDAAFTSAMAAQKVDGKRFEGFAVASLALKEQGKYSAAVAMLEKAIALAPSDKREQLLAMKERLNELREEELAQQAARKEASIPVAAPVEGRRPGSTSMLTNAPISQFVVLSNGFRCLVLEEGTGPTPKGEDPIWMRKRPLQFSEGMASVVPFVIQKDGISTPAPLPLPRPIKFSQLSTNHYDSPTVSLMRQGSKWWAIIPTNYTSKWNKTEGREFGYQYELLSPPEGQ